jgi:uncharacterized protein (UPF0332 family)
MIRYSERLLAQALHLAKRDPFRPEQVNLRRAMSAAYYALFHALVDASCRGLVGAGVGERFLRAALARVYAHSELERASRAFAQGRNGLPRGLQLALGTEEVSMQLRELADLLHRIQEERHKADYDLSVAWQRSQVLARIESVESCLQYLRRERSAKDLRAYLTSILVWNRISNR